MCVCGSPNFTRVCVFVFMCVCLCVSVWARYCFTRFLYFFIFGRLIVLFACTFFLACFFFETFTCVAYLYPKCVYWSVCVCVCFVNCASTLAHPPHDAGHYGTAAVDPVATAAPQSLPDPTERPGLPLRLAHRAADQEVNGLLLKTTSAPGHVCLTCGAGRRSGHDSWSWLAFIYLFGFCVWHSRYFQLLLDLLCRPLVILVCVGRILDDECYWQ